LTPENQNSSLLDNGSVNIFPRKRTRATIQGVFSVVRAARVETQRCGKHISAAVIHHATIEETVFSVGAAPRIYNEDITQVELQLSSGVDSYSRELTKLAGEGD
jgi:hypothetical protein